MAVAFLKVMGHKILSFTYGQIIFLDKGYDEREKISDQRFGELQIESNLYFFFMQQWFIFSQFMSYSNRNAASSQTRKICNNYTVFSPFDGRQQPVF